MGVECYTQCTGSDPGRTRQDLANLEALRVDSNQLTGSIPPELVNLVELRFLGTYNNPLTVLIPAGLGTPDRADAPLSGRSTQRPDSVEFGNLVNPVNLESPGK